MAEHGRTEYATATGNDYAEHEATYANVMKLAKVGIATSILIMIALGIYGTHGSVLWTSVAILLAVVTSMIGLARDSIVLAAGSIVLMLLVWALLV